MPTTIEKKNKETIAIPDAGWLANSKCDVIKSNVDITKAAILP
jgi:hypothetical protein